MLCLLSHTCDLTNQILINSGFYVFLLKQNTAQTVSENSVNNFLGGKRQRSGRGSVCLHVMIVRFSNSLFLSQHCAVLCLFFFLFQRKLNRHYKSFISLSKSNQESFFSRVVFLKTNLGFFCPEQHRFLLSLCVCLLLAPMLILPIV